MNLCHRLHYFSKTILNVRNNLCLHRYRQPIQTYYCTPTSVLQNKYFSTSRKNYSRKNKNDTGFLKSIVSKIPFINLTKSRLKATGYMLYESVADNIQYVEFFEKFCLPDTFNSWFLITELHVWMLLVRIMAEGEDGRYTRNCIVQALWADVNSRAKKLGAANPSGVQMQVDELSQQFQAALVAYDEGLQSNDKVLACALWRRFFNQNCDSPENLESLIHYVRKQVQLLDGVSSDELLENRKVVWIPLQKI